MPKEKGFTLVELLIVIAIIGILTAVGLASFTSSQIKSRDVKRKTNLSQIAQSLELYNNDMGRYPSSSSGKIMGCGAGAINLCNWGTDAFSNTTTGTVYMIKLPADPGAYTYYYVSTGKTYQLYAYIENVKDGSIITTGYSCGSSDCNYGVSSSNTKP